MISNSNIILNSLENWEYFEGGDYFLFPHYHEMKIANGKIIQVCVSVFPFLFIYLLLFFNMNSVETLLQHAHVEK